MTPEPTATATRHRDAEPGSDRHADSLAYGLRPRLAPTTHARRPSPISIAEARALSDGAAVIVEGVALTDGDFTDGGGYLTDGGAGIAVLLSDGTFTRGQLLRVAGTVDDRYAQRTIRTSVAQLTLLGTGSEPLPVDADTGSVGEPVEGQLVELTGLIASSATTLSIGIAWDLDDGTRRDSRRHRHAPPGSTPPAGSGGVGLTLIGVVGQRDSSGSGTPASACSRVIAADLIAVEPARDAEPEPRRRPPEPTAIGSRRRQPHADGAPSPTPLPPPRRPPSRSSRSARRGPRLRERTSEFAASSRRSPACSRPGAPSSRTRPGRS